MSYVMISLTDNEVVVGNMPEEGGLKQIGIFLQAAIFGTPKENGKGHIYSEIPDPSDVFIPMHRITFVQKLAGPLTLEQLNGKVKEDKPLKLADSPVISSYKF